MFDRLCVYFIALLHFLLRTIGMELLLRDNYMLDIIPLLALV